MCDYFCSTHHIGNHFLLNSCISEIISLTSLLIFKKLAYKIRSLASTEGNYRNTNYRCLSPIFVFTDLSHHRTCVSAYGGSYFGCHSRYDPISVG